MSDPPVLYATLTSQLLSRQAILQVIPTTSDNLLLRHPSSEISIIDGQSLKLIDSLQDGHGIVNDIIADEEAIWSGTSDGMVLRWDVRSRRVGMTIRAHDDYTVPITAIASSQSDYLVMAATQSSYGETPQVLFFDTRNPKTPAYTHTEYSDDIMHLSLLPPSSSFVNSFSATSASTKVTNRLLLSASKDGVITLRDINETEGDDAVVCSVGTAIEIQDAGWYFFADRKDNGKNDKDKLKIWARGSDCLDIWTLDRPKKEKKANTHLFGRHQEEDDDEEYEEEEDGLVLIPEYHLGQEDLIGKKYDIPDDRPKTTLTAEEEMISKRGKRFKSDYLINLIPPFSSSILMDSPIFATGTNSGDIVLNQFDTHHTQSNSPDGGQREVKPVMFMLSGPDVEGHQRGHKRKIRAIYHDLRNEVIYSGSEDGVLAGWSIAGLDRDLDDADEEEEGSESGESLNTDEELEDGSDSSWER